MTTTDIKNPLMPQVRIELTTFRSLRNYLRLWDWRAAYCATEALEIISPIIISLIGIGTLLFFRTFWLYNYLRWKQMFYSLSLLSLIDNTEASTNNIRFYLIWGCWIQIWNLFLLITYRFLDKHSMHFVHVRYIKTYMNSGLILILWDLWLNF